jgi:predicted SnoaL-like aldol condensation-catalyzing enzyme
MTVDLKHVIAEKDYVAIHFVHRLRPDERGQSIMGIFRVTKREGGEFRIIEHWDVVQEEPVRRTDDAETHS